MVAITDAIAIVACGIAVATDLRNRRIPNALTISAALSALVLHAVFGAIAGEPVRWLASALAGAAVGGVVFGVPAAWGLVGMGDVKLAIAIGALLRWPLALSFTLDAAIAGGIVALAYAIRSGRTRAVARNLLARDATRLHRMPYALALALGCAWAVATRYVEALRWI